ncbi:MAG TPA: VTT domain-containing protein [Candidatus Binatia bacterium]|nr:VTT domain-containing protein [Candidatus Binatia bacterium]
MESLWDLFHRIYDVEALVRVGGLVGLTAIVFVETGLLVGFFLPGDSLLVTAGLFAARGDLELLPMIVCLSVAAIVGDTVGYNIGARTGPKLFTRPDSLLFNKKHLITTKEFYERHGPFTIVIARFIPILRTFAPVVAGIGAMQYRRFVIYNIAGGIGWVLTTVLGGYFLGQMIPNIHDHLHKVIAVVIVLSLMPAIIKVAREKLKTKPSVSSSS